MLGNSRERERALENPTLWNYFLQSQAQQHKIHPGRACFLSKENYLLSFSVLSSGGGGCNYGEKYEAVKTEVGGRVEINKYLAV